MGSPCFNNMLTIIFLILSAIWLISQFACRSYRRYDCGDTHAIWAKADIAALYQNARRVRRVLTILLCLYPLVCAALLLVTYNHPIVLGDYELYLRYRDDCVKYSHDLIGKIGPIDLYAQVAVVTESDSASAKMLLVNLFVPFARVRVWHCEGDVPYWESGFKAYG